MGEHLKLSSFDQAPSQENLKGQISLVNSGCKSSSNIHFSIIVPVYNADRYLEECIQSVLNQEYESYRIILINDGSSDTSADICDYYLQQHPESISVIHQTNKGALLARRAGIGLVEDGYVIFVDADDMLVQGALQCLASVIESTKADVIHYESRREMKDSSIELDACSNPNLHFIIESKPHILMKLCTSTQLNSLWSKAIHINCLRKNNDFEAFGNLPIGEDLLQSIFVYDEASTFFSLPKALYFYRRNSNSVTSNYRAQYFQGISAVLDVLEDYAQTWEQQYEMEGLRDGVSGLRLDSIANYAEELAASRDRGSLRSLRRDQKYSRLYSTASCCVNLRADRKIEIWALENGLNFVIVVIGFLRRRVSQLKKYYETARTFETLEESSQSET